MDEQALFEAMTAAGFEVELVGPQGLKVCAWASSGAWVEFSGELWDESNEELGVVGYETPADVVAACRAARLRPDGSRPEVSEVLDDDGTLILPPLSPWAYILDVMPDLRIDDDLAAALSRASQMSKGFWLAMQAQYDERVPPHPADTEAMSPEFWAAVSAREAAQSEAVVGVEAVENRPGMRVEPTMSRVSPFEAAGVAPEQRHRFALDLPLTDGQAGIIRELLVTYAEESGQAPIWSHAVALAEINGVPRAELEALRSLFPDDGGGR